MDYMNPFAMITNPGLMNATGIPDPGNMAAFEASRQNTRAQPFINMAEQNMQMDTAKKSSEMADYFSPEAAQQRAMERQLKGLETQSKITKAPKELQRDLDKIDAEIKKLPHQTEADIAAANELTRIAQGTPLAGFIGGLGDHYTAMEKVPEGARPLMWKQIIDIEKAQGRKVPPGLEEWNQDTQNFLASIKHAQLNSIKQQQTMQIEGVRTERAVQIAEGNNQATVDAARIRADGSGNNRPPTTNQGVQEAIRIMNDPNSSPQEKETAFQRYLADPMIARQRQNAVNGSLDVLTGKKSREQVGAEWDAAERKGRLGNSVGPKQQTFEVGKTYTGRTGTYKYLGGNPKDPKSFQKVN